ncbi:MAG: LysM peptidoglycan-binding domain-containing protein [Gemmatimonadales bacterium]
MRETEGLYRTVRFVKRLVIGLVTLVVVIAAVGFLFLTRQVDPHSAWNYAQRELDGGMLHYGELPMRVARVYRRRATSYFRAANGLLLATPERVIFVGLEPRDKLAGADAPATILTSEFPDDTLLSATTRRVFALSAHGIVLSRGARTESYAAARGYEDQLDSLVGYVHARQREIQAAAAQDRRLRAQLAELLQQPLYYVVERGDAISTIATRFGASPEEIRKWNNLPGDKVRIGQKLLVRPGK